MTVRVSVTLEMDTDCVPPSYAPGANIALDRELFAACRRDGYTMESNITPIAAGREEVGKQ